ncbi:MAG: tripartite tricarboxylate transporter permease [Akkermansiaceae bacterium]
MIFEALSAPNLVFLVLLGTSLGIAVGAIPGLTGAMLISLSLPLTFSMDEQSALALLVSMYVGSVSGGLITATLLRMPGTPASIITTLDGYPMAQAGKAGRALGLGIGASFIGGILSWIALALIAKPIAELSTQLGPWEFFSLVLMSLVLVIGVSGDSLVRGALSCLLGILCALPGTAPGSGDLRLTFGVGAMDDGFKLLPVLIGLFALSRVFAVPSGQATEQGKVEGRIVIKLKEWKAHWVSLLRSSTIGTGVGILPGIGANIGSLIAYSTARATSKKPEAFGKGCDEGVVASESANNATVGGALVPLIALGIPGSVIDAILLGAFVIHGVQPGPMLFANEPKIVGTIISSYLWANVAMVVMMLLSARWISRLSRIKAHILIPVVAAFCVLGSYSLANRFFDVWVMVGFGVLGCLLERWKIPLAPFVIGFVLMPLGEESMVAALMSSGGGWAPLLTRPMSLSFLILAGLLLFWSLRQRRAISPGTE